MTVKPRGTSFQATVHFKGARYRRDFETEREALIWEAETLAKVRKGEPVDGRSKARSSGEAATIGDVFAKAKALRWDRLNGSAGTARCAGVFVSWVGAKITPAQALTDDMLDAFTEYLIDTRGVSNNTINHYFTAISVLIEFARLDVKPTIKWLKVGRGRVRFFSPEEEAQIIRLWRDWGLHAHADLFMFLVDSGARPYAEACRFKWSDLTADKSVTFWETKNNTSRTVPLTTRAWEAVQRQPREQEGPFTNFSENSFHRLWPATREALPAVADAVLYTTRHTTASRLVQRGVDLRRVKDWMGHKSINTTMIYAHLQPEHLRDAVAVLEQPTTPTLRVVA